MPAAVRFLKKIAPVVFFGLVVVQAAGPAAQDVRNAQDARASIRLLDKMKTLLGADRDFYARVSVLEGSAPVVEFEYFRSDARPAFLLYQTFPSYLAGLAWLGKAGLLQAFNPECGCASETYESVMRERAGVSFEELNPAAFAGRAVRGRADAGRVRNEAAVSVVLFSPAESDVRLSLSASVGLPLRLEYLDGKNEAARTVDYLAWFAIGGKYFPRRLRVSGRGGPEMTVELSAPSYHPLPDYVFTKAYLEELGK